MSENTANGLLREVARLYVQLQRQEVACCGDTTLSQCLVVTTVGRDAPLTLAQLGERLGLGKSWTSRAVERLVKQGLLNKAPDHKDRRQMIVTLTPAGEQRCNELNQALNNQSMAVMGRIPVEERDNVYHALKLLLMALRLELRENGA